MSDYWLVKCGGLYLDHVRQWGPRHLARRYTTATAARAAARERRRFQRPVKVVHVTVRRRSNDHAIITAAREFVRLYGDGSYTQESALPMFAALDRLREAVGKL